MRLTTEAKYDNFVITDGDVRVRPDYLRTMMSPFRDPKVGAATCLYVSTEETNLVQELQSIGMISDFFAPVMVAWQLDDLKVTFGQSIITTREAVKAYGGYQMIEDRPADDVYAGRLVAEKGYEVKLLPYVVQSVADFKTMSDLLHKRTRWMTVQRLMRPWGHVGLIFTFGLPWALMAIATHPTVRVAAIYLGGYALCRVAITWMIGHGLKQKDLWKKMPLIPLWDAMAFLMWLMSFRRRTIRWRGVDYFLREGRLDGTAGCARGREERLSLKIAVAGAGIYGTNIAIRLAEQGHNVRLFDPLGILRAASVINQFRIHSGYHYPRSPETISETLEARGEFTEAFAPAIVRKSQHYYAIPKEGSQTPPDLFEKVMAQFDVPLVCTPCPPGVDGFQFQYDRCYEVDEQIYDPDILREIVTARVQSLGIPFLERRLFPAEHARPNMISVVYATLRGLGPSRGLFQNCEVSGGRENSDRAAAAIVGNIAGGGGRAVHGIRSLRKFATIAIRLGEKYKSLDDDRSAGAGAGTLRQFIERAGLRADYVQPVRRDACGFSAGRAGVEGSEVSGIAVHDSRGGK